MGYIRGLVHGAVIGTVAGICIAPQKGDETRRQLQQAADRARGVYGSVQEHLPQIQRAAQQAAPQAQRAAMAATALVGSVVERVQSRRAADDLSTAAEVDRLEREMALDGSPYSPSNH